MAVEDVKSKIVAATVYESRAQVHRSAKATLNKGATSLVFSDIPAAVDKDSVQVGLRAVSDAAPVGALSLNGITFEVREKTPDPTETKAAKEKHQSLVEKLEAELKDLEQEEEELTLQEQDLATEVDLTEDFFNMAVTDRGNEDPTVYEDTAMWEKIVTAKLGKNADFLERSRALSAAKAELTKKLQAKRLALRNARAADPTSTAKADTPIMMVHLEAKEDIGEVEVMVSYMMPNASWQAAYDLRVNTKTGGASITYHAIVRQNSVEAWTNASLTMSTAKPSVSGRAPDLVPWRANLTLPRPVNHGRAMKRSGGGGSRSKGYDRAVTEKMMMQCDAVLDDFDGGSYDDDDDDGLCDVTSAEPAAFVAAQASEPTAGTAVTFDVPNTHTVPENNDAVRVSLTVIQLTPEITYATRPSAAEVAYAILNATNPSSFTLMPGEANVFVDGQFITKTSFPRIAPKNMLRVGIGQESSISVKYKVLKDHSSELGGMLSTRKHKREFFRQIVVKNLRDTPATIKVEHEYPTADDSRIEVTVVEPQLPQDALDSSEGSFSTTIDLAPRQEKKIPVHIAVTYPTDMTVLGL
jgi:hypothetical protein